MVSGREELAELKPRCYNNGIPGYSTAATATKPSRERARLELDEPVYTRCIDSDGNAHLPLSERVGRSSPGALAARDALLRPAEAKHLSPS